MNKPSNPFSQFLRQFAPDHDFDAFVAQWDILESLVVRIYRNKMPAADAQADYDRVWPWLREAYARWEPVLRPYWQATKAAGEATQEDPFQLLLDLPGPVAILDNWPAMQHLPAARESINRLLRDLGKDA